MGALSPLFLLAGVAVAVPLFLHLFQRHRARRVSFPALRYLERTEREHARRIRFRQLLLLVLRVAVLVLVVLAGARLFLRARGEGHPPTAVAVVLDNTASSGRVVGDRRLLDELKDRALETLEAAGPDDRFWILRAGEPWRTPAPLPPAEARAVVEGTVPTAAGVDLAALVARAAELVATTSLEAGEVHLLSDLQVSAFPADAPALPEGTPVVVWEGAPLPAPNLGLVSVEVGGGLPPLAGQRSQVGVTTAGPDSAELAVRLVVDGRVRGAATVPGGSQGAIPLPAVPDGWVAGRVERDPDDLGADDVRHFAFRARPAPSLEVRGPASAFVREAAEVLRAAGRVAAPAGAADLVVSVEGEGLEEAGGAGAVLVVPPADAAVLAALNRRLATAGIPWRYGRSPGEGQVPLEGTDLPDPLLDVQVRRAYRLELAGTPPTAPRTLARAAGAPWAVEGSTARGLRYLLLASPLDEASTSLPVSAEMVRFVDWAAGAWAAVGGGPVEHAAGEPLAAPRGAERVRFPDGSGAEVDGTRLVRTTGQAGLYTFLDADSGVVAVRAVNPPPSESDLTPLAGDALADRLGGDVTRVDRPDRWGRAVFRARQGPELWFPLLAVGLLLLVVESLVAASGRSARPARRASPPPASTDAA